MTEARIFVVALARATKSWHTFHTLVLYITQVSRPNVEAPGCWNFISISKRYIQTGIKIAGYCYLQRWGYSKISSYHFRSSLSDFCTVDLCSTKAARPKVWGHCNFVIIYIRNILTHRKKHRSLWLTGDKVILKIDPSVSVTCTVASKQEWQGKRGKLTVMLCGITFCDWRMLCGIALCNWDFMWRSLYVTITLCGNHFLWWITLTCHVIWRSCCITLTWCDIMFGAITLLTLIRMTCCVCDSQNFEQIQL